MKTILLSLFFVSFSLLVNAQSKHQASVSSTVYDVEDNGPTTISPSNVKIGFNNQSVSLFISERYIANAKVVITSATGGKLLNSQLPFRRTMVVSTASYLPGYYTVSVFYHNKFVRSQTIYIP